jgi:hypothetical protein
LHDLQQLAQNGILHTVDNKRLLKFFVFSVAFLLVIARFYKTPRKWLRLWSLWLTVGLAFVLASGSLALFAIKVF